MTANYEKEQKELLELVANGNKKLQDAEQNTVQPPFRGLHRIQHKNFVMRLCLKAFGFL